MMQVGTEAALMLLFVPPTSFDGFGEHPYDGTTLSQLLAGLIVIVSFLSLRDSALVTPPPSSGKGTVSIPATGTLSEAMQGISTG
jgi:hypothetical protein